jgi:hypothetical protein
MDGERRNFFALGEAVAKNARERTGSCASIIERGVKRIGAGGPERVDLIDAEGVSPAWPRFGFSGERAVRRHRANVAFGIRTLAQFLSVIFQQQVSPGEGIEG